MINQLITDIAYDNIKLSQAITRAKLIESKIKNETLKKWLNKELEGYDLNDAYLPKYRKVWSVIHLYAVFPFGQAQSFPVVLDNSYGKQVLDTVNYHQICEPISIVEQQIDNLQKPKGYIKIPPHQVSILAGIYKNELDQNEGVIISGQREVGKVHYQTVLELTKQKLLDTLMELESEFPNLINDYQMTKENEEKVQNIITNNIYGNNNPMNIAAGSSVEQSNNTTINDTQTDRLKQLGVDETQINELKMILSQNPKDKSTLTGKVLGWLGSASASVAARGFYDNLPALTQFAHEIIK